MLIRQRCLWETLLKNFVMGGGGGEGRFRFWCCCLQKSATHFNRALFLTCKNNGWGQTLQAHRLDLPLLSIDQIGYWSHRCTYVKSPGVKILCILYLHDNVVFIFKWHGNTCNKTLYFQRVWLGYNIELADLIYWFGVIAHGVEEVIWLILHFQNQRAQTIDLIHDSRHAGFSFIMQISCTLLRGQTTQVREVITNILATKMICFTFNLVFIA